MRLDVLDESRFQHPLAEQIYTEWLALGISSRSITLETSLCRVHIFFGSGLDWQQNRYIH